MGGGMKMLVALALFAVATPSFHAAAAPALRKATRPIAVKPVDWTKRVVVTAEGGFLVGNPAARAKLIEYGSLSCPYCQRFHQEAIAGLRARIATG
ncbi:MAG: protein-disulfide isomerase, partial [Sphingomonas bacterium]|nr:protein-disulfide isomerase [Sphingomonas bacterium]